MLVVVFCRLFIVCHASLKSHFPDMPSPVRLFGKATVELESTMSAGTNFGPGAARMFANGPVYVKFIRLVY